MKLVDKKNGKLMFKAEIEDSLANAIRRYVFQVPTLAIDEVEVSRNDSPLYDETIAHRLGLIPLSSSKSINDKTTATLKLSTKKEGNVYSGELHGGIKVVYDSIPITALNKGQEMELVATAKMGRGSEHSKFSPGFMVYRNIVEVIIDKNIPKEALEDVPEGIIKEGKMIVDAPVKWDAIETCADVCKRLGKECITITPTNELMITIESFGQLEAEEIFKGAVEELQKDIEEVSKQVSKSKD